MRGKDDVIAYHLRQSFVPGEITPEEANRLGVELARRFTKGKHAFIVCTHIDKAHVHNHIIWNSTTLECDRKFRNFWGSTRAVHRLSDTICIENGYSIVEAPSGAARATTSAGRHGQASHKEQLRQSIDRALAQKPASWRNCCICWSRKALPFTGAGKPYPSARRVGATTSASTGWVTATRWMICWRFFQAKRYILPES